MTALFYFLMSAGGVVTIFVAAAAALWLRPQSAALRRGVLAVALVYGLCSMYVVPALAEAVFISGYHKFEAADAPGDDVAIAVLGAGDEVIFGWDGERHFLPYPSAASRVLEARRVFRLINAKCVISSGGNRGPHDPAEPPGINMRTMLVQIGVPADRIVVETESFNTHDEAVVIAKMLPSLKVTRVVVVTSALHMRRSIAVFRGAGVDAVPAIVPQPSYGLDWDDWLLPGHSGLSYSSDVLHELIGIPYYWLRGWTRKR